MGNFISLNREVLSHWVSDRQDYFFAWVSILMRANYKDIKKPYKGKIITIERGSFVTSERKLSELTKLKRTSLNTFLAYLVSDNMVSIEKSDYTKITITNYNKYQESTTSNSINNAIEEEIGSQESASSKPTPNQQSTNSQQQLNKDNKDNKDIIIMSDIISLLKKSNLPAIRSFTDKRKKHLKARINESKEFQTIEFWEKFVEIINNSDFLSNRIENKGKHKNWKADIDFVLKPDNFNKILEGKYNNSQNNSVSSMENQMKLLDEMGIE